MVEIEEEKLQRFAGRDARHRAPERDRFLVQQQGGDVRGGKGNSRWPDGGGGGVVIREGETQAPAGGPAVGHGPGGIAGEGGGEEVGGIHLSRDHSFGAGHECGGAQIPRGGPSASRSGVSHGPDCDIRRAGGHEGAHGDDTGGGASTFGPAGTSSPNSSTSSLGVPRRDQRLNPSLASNRFWRLASEDSDDDSGGGVVVNCKTGIRSTDPEVNYYLHPREKPRKKLDVGSGSGSNRKGSKRGVRGSSWLASEGRKNHNMVNGRVSSLLG